jgi:FixJ family two-component response regulator
MPEWSWPAGSILRERRDVVVVDDDPGMLSAISRLLKAHGFEVQAYQSASAFRTHAKMSNVACLILDIDLGGESGIELRNQLSNSVASLPVIFITASDRDETRKTALDAGCLAFFRKPFSGGLLVDAVREAGAVAK